MTAVPAVQPVPPRPRVRMARELRHLQLLDVSRQVFAGRGFELGSIEEVASAAGVSKPVVYEHFATKERLVAEVIEREMAILLERITSSLVGETPQELLGGAVRAFLTYVEENEDGFRVLLHQSPDPAHRGRFLNVLGEIATRVEDGFALAFSAHGEDPRLAPISAQMLVGMVAFAGQFWIDARVPEREAAAAHIVRMAWSGLSDMVDVIPPARVPSGD
ncbi:MAG: TetR family transcriptional regulator [Frankiales bacterium]|nr:TetR family transcriptional regulator [Frankiales bacterium]